jgi:hypothetical protein
VAVLLRAILPWELRAQVAHLDARGAPAWDELREARLVREELLREELLRLPTRDELR